MVLGNFTSNFLAQIDNPACSYLTGIFIGVAFFVKLCIMFIGLYIILKTVDKLAFEPFLNWIKNKIYHKKK